MQGVPLPIDAAKALIDASQELVKNLTFYGLFSRIRDHSITILRGTAEDILRWEAILGRDLPDVQERVTVYFRLYSHRSIIILQSLEEPSGKSNVLSPVSLIHRIEGIRNKIFSENASDQEGPLEKKSRMVSPADVEIDPREERSGKFDSVAEIQRLMSQAFPNKIPSLTRFLSSSVSVMIDICLFLTSQRFLEDEPFTLEEVNNIHALLSHQSISVACNEAIQASSISQPHPVAVIRSLHQCMIALSEYASCEQALETVTLCQQQRPQLLPDYQRFLGDRSVEQLQPILDEIRNAQGSEELVLQLSEYIERLKTHEAELKRFPLAHVKVLQPGILQGVNETYFLCADRQIQWVFKHCATHSEYGWFVHGDRGDSIMKAECIASSLNHRHQFPIPLTIQMMIKNWKGSAQMYVANARPCIDMRQQFITPLLSLLLQRLVIFDLLFSNADRHEGNLLFTKILDEDTVFGIDHDQCLGFGRQAMLKLDYAHLLKDLVFDETLIELLTAESLKRYATILEAHFLMDAKRWMFIAAKRLSGAIEGRIPITNVVNEIKGLYQRYLERDAIGESGEEDDLGNGSGG